MFPEQKVGLATTTISNINMTKSLVKVIILILLIFTYCVVQKLSIRIY